MFSRKSVNRDLLREEPYGKIINHMIKADAEGIPVRIGWLCEQRIASRKSKSGFLSESVISRKVNDLVNAEFVTKEKWVFTLKKNYSEIKTALDIEDRVKNNDLEILDSGIVAWGGVSKFPMMGDIYIPALREMRMQLARQLMVRTFTDVEDNVLKVVAGKNLSVVEKLVVLNEVAYVVGNTVVQLGWDDPLLDDLKIKEMVKKMSSKNGLQMVKDGNQRKELRALAKRYDEKKKPYNADFSTTRVKKIKKIIDEITSPLLPRSSLLVTVSIPILEGDRLMNQSSR